MNLSQVLATSARRYADKVAIDFEGNSFTYREIDKRISKYAAFLKMVGIGKGDRVAIQLPKCMEFIFTHLAVLSIRAITLPLNPDYAPEEVEYFLSDSESSVLVTDHEHFLIAQKKISDIENLKVVLTDVASPHGFKSLLQEVEDVTAADVRTYPTNEDDVAMICYTSGTTGKPKGAMITHKNLVTNMMALKKIWRWTDSDVLLHVLPIFHVHGLGVALHGGLNAGSTIVMRKKFDPVRTWEDLSGVPCTLLMGVPTIYYRLLREINTVKPDLSKMRVFISGSAPLLENLFYRFEEATGFRILERYGMTEAQMITSNPYEPERRIPKSVGYPLPGVRVRVVGSNGVDVEPGQVGEVWIKGDNVFKGYWKNPEKTCESLSRGWFRSGDLGYQDINDNYRLYLVGRAKELIITGGYNVYPKEVENVLEEHDAIREASVVAVPDEDFGERVTAAVVVSRDAAQITEEELVQYCKERLVSYKCPKTIFKLDALPRNAMGKVQKHILQRWLSSGK